MFYSLISMSQSQFDDSNSSNSTLEKKGTSWAEQLIHQRGRERKPTILNYQRVEMV